MINFIICDDNENFLMREKKLVNNFMMNYDADYKITDFSDYTEEFFQAMYDETCFNSPFSFFLSIISPKKAIIHSSGTSFFPSL